MGSHPALSTLRILWAALLGAVFLYMGLAYGILPKQVAATPSPIMLPMLGGLSFVVAIMSFFLPRFLYPQAAKGQSPKIEEEVAPNVFPDRYREAMPKRVVFADPKAATASAYAVFMTPFIVSIALSESVALFGLVLAQIGFDAKASLPFFVAGATLVAIRFPQHETVLEMFAREKGASFPVPNG